MSGKSGKSKSGKRSKPAPTTPDTSFEQWTADTSGNLDVTCDVTTLSDAHGPFDGDELLIYYDPNDPYGTVHFEFASQGKSS